MILNGGVNEGVNQKLVHHYDHPNDHITHDWAVPDWIAVCWVCNCRSGTPTAFLPCTGPRIVEPYINRESVEINAMYGTEYDIHDPDPGQMGCDETCQDNPKGPNHLEHLREFSRSCAEMEMDRIREKGGEP